MPSALSVIIRPTFPEKNTGVLEDIWNTPGTEETASGYSSG